MALSGSLFKKKIPTIFGLIILFVGAIAGVYLVGKNTNFLPRASAEYAPRQVRVTNITDRSFTVSWTTDQSTSGFVKYGTTTSLGSTIQDDRDQLSGNSGSFRTHFVTVRGITAGTKYFFKIGSGPNQSLYDNNGQPYEISSGPDIGVAPTSDIASGTIVTNAQAPAEGAIVYLTLSQAGPLSGLVRASGSWAVTISNARTPDLASYATFTPDAVVSFEIIGPTGQVTTGTLPLSSLDPAPIITLGQNFDSSTPPADTTGDTTTTDTTSTDTSQMSDTQNPADTSADQSTTSDQSMVEDPTATESADLGSSQFNLDPLGNGSTATGSSNIALTSITHDGELINTTQPEIQGTASPGETLTILVESDPQTGTVIADENGEFAWTPPDNLEPGEHTVTITKADGTKLVRTFIVAAPGESELPALTSSASGQTTTTPTPTPSPSPKTTPTPSPVGSGSSRISQPSTSSGIPVAGSLTPTLTLFIMGIGLIISGIILSKKMTS